MWKGSPTADAWGALAGALRVQNFPASTIFTENAQIVRRIIPVTEAATYIAATTAGAESARYHNLGSGCPTSKNDFKLESTLGQPLVMPRSISESGSRRSCVTVRRTT